MDELCSTFSPKQFWRGHPLSWVFKTVALVVGNCCIIATTMVDFDKSIFQFLVFLPGQRLMSLRLKSLRSYIQSTWTKKLQKWVPKKNNQTQTSRQTTKQRGPLKPRLNPILTWTFVQCSCWIHGWNIDQTSTNPFGSHSTHNILIRPEVGRRLVCIDLRLRRTGCIYARFYACALFVFGYAFIIPHTPSFRNPRTTADPSPSKTTTSRIMFWFLSCRIAGYTVVDIWLPSSEANTTKVILI